MDDTERARKKAAGGNAAMHAALTLLLDRAGGSVEYTEAEYQAVLAKYGGSSRFNIHLEVIREAGRPDTVRVKLEEKAPRNAELVM